MKQLLIIFAGLVLAVSAQAASFDCAKAGTKVEKLICADAGLSKLDEDLNAAYKAALKDEQQAEAIKQAQKQWLKERNSCVDANCVMNAYQERLLLLSQAPHNAPQSQVIKNTYRPTMSSPRYELLQEEPYEPLSEICEEFTAMLNAFGPKEPLMSCEQKLHPDFPKFKPIELQPLPDKDNFKYFTTIADLATREVIRRGYTSYRTDEELKRLFDEKERLGGYKYYLLTTDRFIKNKTITMLVQERQGDCRIEHPSMDSARRIAYEWDAKTQSVVKKLPLFFQTIFTYEGQSMQGDGLLVSYWNDVDLPTPFSKGKSGAIWVHQSDLAGAASPICYIVYNGKH
jgi:uncharacterized protein YecT (DUF1311 family)